MTKALDAKAIGRRLRERRGVFRTQEEVAKETGVDRSRLSRYETGAAIPTDSDKIALANYYGTTVEALFYAQK